MSDPPATSDGPCPCGAGEPLEACCGPYLSGARRAPTAEALMRSRYTAYAVGDIDHVRRTLHAKAREGHDDRSARAWSRKSEWLGLEVVSVEAGGEDDDRGTVEFIARYRQDGELIEHHERATFVREDGAWCFLDGTTPGVETVVRETPKIGRNDPCPCGSGRKHKKCCGR